MAYKGIDDQGLRIDISYATGFLVETGLYCAYTCLFIAAFPGLTKARRLKDSRSVISAWVFLIFSILMYLVATIHLVFAGFRFYKSIFLNDDLDSAISYLRNPNHWEFLGLVVLLCIQTWLGDALVIYQCYCIWDNNLWLVAAPMCLFLGSIGISSYVVYWIGHPFVAPPTSCLVHSIYPLAFVQNFMTTSLIALKIVLQHRESKNAGVVNLGSKLSLVHIVRIFIESAGLYTIQILVLSILFFRDNNFQYVVQTAIIPSIGITFLLLVLRIKTSRNYRSTTKSGLGIRSSMIPRWLREPEREIDSEDRELSGSSLPAGDGANVADQRSDVEAESGMESMNWDSQFLSSSATRPMEATSPPSSSKSGSVHMLKLPV